MAITLSSDTDVASPISNQDLAELIISLARPFSALMLTATLSASSRLARWGGPAQFGHAVAISPAGVTIAFGPRGWVKGSVSKYLEHSIRIAVIPLTRPFSIGQLDTGARYDFDAVPRAILRRLRGHPHPCVPVKPGRATCVTALAPGLGADLGRYADVDGLVRLGPSVRMWRLLAPGTEPSDRSWSVQGV